MAHQYITDLPKNITEYRKNQALIAKAERENVILKRRIQKLENLDEYYKRGERAKRAHRLITKGAAIERILAESKGMEDTDFYQLIHRILSSVEAKKIWKAYLDAHPRLAEEGDP